MAADRPYSPENTEIAHRVMMEVLTALGRFVLETWIAEDTQPIPQAEAEKRAKQLAQQYVQWGQQYPQHFPSKTLQQWYDELLPGILRTCKGSAIGSKGILAVAGACGGAHVAPIVNRYLRQWYGLRAPQSKALVQMLAWVEHPTAVQLVLSVGTRFRTKGIQDEANRQAQAIAERKGWTLEELADRTIPCAGFDENGEMILDYGPRQFTARLADDLSILLANEEGKTISALPDPRAGDDESAVKEAKKLLSASKKEIKTVEKMQRERLYEAMCTQRGWRFEDWGLYLNRHPIMKHLCRRVVWTVARADSPPVTFRPLEDGSFTDAQDERVQLAVDDLVRVAHQCNTPEDVARAWVGHFADYEVEPLAEQFGRPAFHLPEDRREQTEIGEFLGHMVEAFRLRALATKLSYTRGQAEDGGWFYSHHKRFPTLGLEAVIEFTGNSLPEENRTVALRSLHFYRSAPEGSRGYGEPRLPLGEVPPVLLSECWNDIRSIAAEGPGFDPGWEKKTEP